MCDSGGEDNDGGAAAHSADFIAPDPCNVLEEMLVAQKSGCEEEISKYNSKWTLAYFKGPKGWKRFQGWWVGAMSFFREEVFSGFNVVSGEDGREDQRAPLKDFSSVFLLDSPLHADFLEDRLCAQDHVDLFSKVRNPAKARKIQEHLRSGLSPSAVSDVSESAHAVGTDDEENDDEEGERFSVVANEDESIPQIARKTGVEAQKLVKYNLHRFPDLKVNSRLKQGTELLLPPGIDIEDEPLKLSDGQMLVPKTFVLTKDGTLERIFYIEKFACRDGAVLREFRQAAEVREVVRAACPMPLQAEVLQGMEGLGANEYIMMLTGSDNKTRMPVEKLQAMLVRSDVDLRFTERGQSAAVDFLCRYAVSELLWKPAPKNDKERWRKLQNWYLGAADFHRPLRKMLLFFCKRFPAASPDPSHAHEQNVRNDARALGGQGAALGQNEDDEDETGDVESESGESGSAMGEASADPALPPEGSESSDGELNEGGSGGRASRSSGMQGQRWCEECGEYHHHRKRKGCLRHEAQAGFDDKQGEGAGTGSCLPLDPGTGTVPVRRRDDALAEASKRPRTSEDGRGSRSPDAEQIGIGENGTGNGAWPRSGAASFVDGDEGGSAAWAGHRTMQKHVPLSERAQESKLSSKVEESGAPEDERGPATRCREEVASPMGEAEALGCEEMPEEASREAGEDQDREDWPATACTGRAGALPSASAESPAAGFGSGSGSRSRSRCRGASVENDESAEGFQDASEDAGGRTEVTVLPRGVLECQVCMQDLVAETRLEEQTWNCPEGHPLCQRCAATRIDCPTCRASPLVRNRPVEQLARAAVEAPGNRDGVVEGGGRGQQPPVVEGGGRGQQPPVHVDAAAMGHAAEDNVRELEAADEHGVQGEGAGFEEARGEGGVGGERGSRAPNQVRVPGAPLAEHREAPGENMEVEDDLEEGGGRGEDAMKMKVEEDMAGRDWSKSKGSASCGRGDSAVSGNGGKMSDREAEERCRRLSSAASNARAASGDAALRDHQQEEHSDEIICVDDSDDGANRAQEKVDASRSAGASQGLGMRARIGRCEKEIVEEEKNGNIKQRIGALETLLFGEPRTGGLENRLKCIEKELGLDA